MTQRVRGFTLIELLVVVAIIALLIALMLPSLQRAREQSKTVQCASNMRQIGQIVHLFAEERDGRGPGGGHGRIKPTDSTGTSFSWVDILNAEVLQRSAKTKYTVDMRGGNSPRTLSCPNFIQAPGGSYREAAYNGDACALTASGGRISGYPLADPNLSVPERQAVLALTGLNSYYPSVSPLDKYNLGAKLGRFAPHQFLLIEAYAGNDSTNGVTGDVKGRLMGPFQAAGFINSAGYGPAFRHPYFYGSNFLFFDGRVQTMGPKEDVADHAGVSKAAFSHWAMPY